MVAPCRATGDLQIIKPVLHVIAAQHFADDLRQGRAAHGHVHGKLVERAFQTVQVPGQIDDETMPYLADLVDAIGELEAAVLHVHRCLVMAKIASVHIGNSRHVGLFYGRCGRKVRGSGRPQTPSDFSLRCSAERSMPTNSAVREMLPPKRLIWATR